VQYRVIDGEVIVFKSCTNKTTKLFASVEYFNASKFAHLFFGVLRQILSNSCNVSLQAAESSGFESPNPIQILKS